MIPDSIVEEVRLRADIVQTIGERVALRRAGKEFKALCPFHQERTPSFYVVPSKGFYKCFGCGESGDIFSFLMKQGGLSFQESVRQLAGEVGVLIPERSSEREIDEPYRLLYEAMAFAIDFFQRQLQSPGIGALAREYLDSRGIGAEAIERFQIGYAPPEWRSLREAAHAHGISDEVLLDAGLIKESGRGGEPYDRQRDRVIFPIADIRGRIIALGGRLLTNREGAPKYLNSPETPIYQKSLHLYGLNWSRTAIRREGSVLVVEGYMDYISLAAHGVENVVAGLGTALTAEQGVLLSRYTRQALLLYDSDAAGLRATFRSADLLLGSGVHPLVVTLPPGQDPDSVVRRGGSAALQPHLDAAVDVLDRKLQILENRGYLKSSEGTRKAVDGLLPTLRATLDPMLRDIYIARIAERTGVRRETLESELATDSDDRGGRPRSGRGSGRPRHTQADNRRWQDGPPPEWAMGGPPEDQTSRDRSGYGRAEQRKLLLLMLRDESRITAVGESLGPEIFSSAADRELFEELMRSGGLQDGDPLSLELSDEGRARLEELLGDRTELGDADRVFRELVGNLRAQSIFERIEVLQGQLGERSGDEQAETFRELTELTGELRELGSELRALGFKLSKRYRRYLRM